VGGLAALLAVLGLLTTIRTYWGDRSALLEREAARVTSVASGLAAGFGGSQLSAEFQNLPERGTILEWTQAPARFQVLRDALLRAREASEVPIRVRTLCLRTDMLEAATREPGSVHEGALEVVVSTDAAPEWREREPYEPVMEPAWFEGRVVPARFVDDEHGERVLRVLAPVLDEWGAVAALVQADAPVDPLLSSLNRGAAAWFLFLALLGAAAVGAAWFQTNRVAGALERMAFRAHRPAVDPTAPEELESWPDEGPVEEISALALALEAERARVRRESEEAARLGETAHHSIEAAHRSADGHRSFLATLAHELRESVGGLEACLGELGTAGLEGRLQDAVRRGTGLAAAVSHELDEIATMTRLQLGRYESTRQAFDLHRVLETAVARAAELARRSNITFRWVAPAEDDHALLGDPHALHHVVAGLAEHAVRTTKQGGVSVRVSNVPAQGEQRILRIEVVGSGEGPAASDLAALRDPFAGARVQPGLGLSIALALCERIGVRLECESEPQRGERFALSIAYDVGPIVARSSGSPRTAQDRRTGNAPAPAAPQVVPLVHGAQSFAPSKPEAAAKPRRRVAGKPRRAAKANGRASPAPVPTPAVPAPAAPLPRLPRTIPRILVVLPDADEARSVGRLLHELGLGGAIATDARAAVQALKSGGCDALLVECELPELSGFELTRRIRASRGSLADIPIIGVARAGSLDLRREAVQSGMSDLVERPLEREALERALARSYLARVG